MLVVFILGALISEKLLSKDELQEIETKEERKNLVEAFKEKKIDLLEEVVVNELDKEIDIIEPNIANSFI